MEFLVDQQAKFWAALEAERAERREGFAEVKDMLRDVVAVQRTLIESQIITGAQVGQLTEAQQRADARMDALIAVVNGLVGRERQEPAAG